MMGNLTKPQQRVYIKMVEQGEYRCINTYKPALALLSAGIAKIQHESFGCITIVPVKESA